MSFTEHLKFSLKWEDFKKIGFLCNGTSGPIFLYESQSFKVIVKFYHLSKFEPKFLSLQNELKALFELYEHFNNRQYFPQFFGYVEEASSDDDDYVNFYLLFERADGNLREIVRKRGKGLNFMETLVFFKTIVRALLVLKEYGIAHDNLKPENVLYFEAKGKIFFKLSDFAYILKEGRGVTTGNPKFRAPEVNFANFNAKKLRLKNENPHKWDVYSLGLLVLFASVGKSPMWDLHSNGDLAFSVRGKEKECDPRKTEVGPYDQEIGDVLFEFNELFCSMATGEMLELIIANCLQYNPQRRLKLRVLKIVLDEVGVRKKEYAAINPKYSRECMSQRQTAFQVPQELEPSSEDRIIEEIADQFIRDNTFLPSSYEPQSFNNQNILQNSNKKQSDNFNKWGEKHERKNYLQTVANRQKKKKNDVVIQGKIWHVDDPLEGIWGKINDWRTDKSIFSPKRPRSNSGSSGDVMMGWQPNKEREAFYKKKEELIIAGSIENPYNKNRSSNANIEREKDLSMEIHKEKSIESKKREETFWKTMSAKMQNNPDNGKDGFNTTQASKNYLSQNYFGMESFESRERFKDEKFNERKDIILVKDSQESLKGSNEKNSEQTANHGENGKSTNLRFSPIRDENMRNNEKIFSGKKVIGKKRNQLTEDCQKGEPSIGGLEAAEKTFTSQQNFQQNINIHFEIQSPNPNQLLKQLTQINQQAENIFSFNNYSPHLIQNNFLPPQTNQIPHPNAQKNQITQDLRTALLPPQLNLNPNKILFPTSNQNFNQASELSAKNIAPNPIFSSTTPNFPQSFCPPPRITSEIHKVPISNQLNEDLNMRIISSPLFKNLCSPIVNQETNQNNLLPQQNANVPIGNQPKDPRLKHLVSPPLNVPLPPKEPQEKMDEIPDVVAKPKKNPKSNSIPIIVPDDIPKKSLTSEKPIIQNNQDLNDLWVSDPKPQISASVSRIKELLISKETQNQEEKNYAESEFHKNALQQLLSNPTKTDPEPQKFKFVIPPSQNDKIFQKTLAQLESLKPKFSKPKLSEKNKIVRKTSLSNPPNPNIDKNSEEPEIDKNKYEKNVCPLPNKEFLEDTNKNTKKSLSLKRSPENLNPQDKNKIKDNSKEKPIQDQISKDNEVIGRGLSKSLPKKDEKPKENIERKNNRKRKREEADLIWEEQTLNFKDKPDLSSFTFENPHLRRFSNIQKKSIFQEESKSELLSVDAETNISETFALKNQCDHCFHIFPLDKLIKIACEHLFCLECVSENMQKMVKRQKSEIFMICLSPNCRKTCKYSQMIERLGNNQALREGLDLSLLSLTVMVENYQINKQKKCPNCCNADIFDSKLDLAIKCNSCLYRGRPTIFCYFCGEFYPSKEHFTNNTCCELEKIRKFNELKLDFCIFCRHKLDSQHYLLDFQNKNCFLICETEKLNVYCLFCSAAVPSFNSLIRHLNDSHSGCFPEKNLIKEDIYFKPYFKKNKNFIDVSYEEKGGQGLFVCSLCKNDMNVHRGFKLNEEIVLICKEKVVMKLECRGCKKEVESDQVCFHRRDFHNF